MIHKLFLVLTLLKLASSAPEPGTGIRFKILQVAAEPEIHVDIEQISCGSHCADYKKGNGDENGDRNGDGHVDGNGDGAVPALPEVEIVSNTSCPESEGFLKSPDMNECFKAIRTQSKEWKEVDSMCKSLGLVFAEPDDDNAVWLQRTLFEKYGDDEYYLGARGTGSVFKWLSDDQELPSTSTLWMPGEPQDVSSYSSLFIGATDRYLKENPGKPYRDGKNKRNYICERIME